MKKVLKFLLPVMMMGVMMLGFVGCGKDSGEVNRSDLGGDVQNSVTATAETSESSTVQLPEANSKDNTVTIYKIGSDKLAVFITGPCCEGVAPRGDGQDGTDQMYLTSDTENNMQIYMSTYYAGVSRSDLNESISSEYGKVEATKNSYFVEVESQGICDIADFGNKITLLAGNGDLKEVLSGSPSEFVKSISEDDYKKVKIEMSSKKVAATPAQASWDGMYMTDSYGDFNGYAEVETTPNGTVHFKAIIDGVAEEYYLEETMYDCAHYDYGDYILADCPLTGMGGSESARWQYHSDAAYEDNISITYTYDNYSTGEYKNASFYKMEGTWREAPKNYEDKDKYGLLSVKHSDDSKYFSPATDNYILRVVSPTEAWNGSESLPCDEYRLVSFDETDHMIDNKIKYVFENEADAKAVYDYYVSSGYEMEFHVSGNVFYKAYGEDDLSYYRKDSKLDYSYAGSDWYKNVNYLYIYDDESNKDYVYLSQPITDDVFSVDVEDMLYWNSMEYGEHACIDTPNASLSVNIDQYSVSICLRDYGDDQDKCMYSGSGVYRVNGRDIVTMDYDTYKSQIFIKEFKFDEEVCEVTEYTYDVADWKNFGVTFENYKSKTPVKTLTHRFDMERVMEYNYY